ncbi:MAG TPA: pentapeptide repeat-containing protein [Pyrinomonadaceae bacterium]
MMTYQVDLNSERSTGDQSFHYRRWRGPFRYPRWSQVEEWRRRWTPEKVADVLNMLGFGASADEIGEKTGFGVLEVLVDQGQIKRVPDLRGLDLARLPPEDRRLGDSDSRATQPLDLSYARLEGSRLIDLNLSHANLVRAHLQKATLRRTNFTGADLTKAQLEDADVRNAILEDARLGVIRYTEDSFLWRGTVLMETHLGRAFYVDPLLERCARDQYYIYMLKYRKRNNPIFRIIFGLWWLTSNYGKSVSLWALWAVLFMLGFAIIFYRLGAGAFAVTSLRWNFQTAVYYSVVTFTTLGFGDITPKTQEAAWWTTAEVIIGYLMLGGLVSIISQKMAQRS